MSDHRKLCIGAFFCFVTIVFTGQTIAVECANTAQGCSGSCPYLMWCGLTWPQMTNCACQDSDGSGGGCGAIISLLPLANSFTAQLSDSSGGSALLAVGNSITLTQDVAFSAEVHHSAAWGGGVQTVAIPAGTLSITSRVTGVDESNQNRRTAVITAIGATLPSFASVALGGSPTGDNVFSVDPSRSGAGWIDATTGEFRFQLYARLYNGVFQASPALVQTVVVGTLNSSTRKVTITNLLGGDYHVYAASPDTTLW